MALFAERAQRKGLILSPRIADDVPPALCGNSTRLQQALSNLLANAIKFSERGTVAVHMDLDQRPPEQCLEFSATRYNELTGSQAHVTHVRFSVVDHGIGMAPRAFNRLFQPFVQADGSTTRKYGGTGLGLAICKQLVEVSDGRTDRSGE